MTDRPDTSAPTVEELRADFEHSKRLSLTRPRFSTEEIGSLFAEIDRLRAEVSERHDLALLVGRLIRRMRAARAGQGIAAGDDALGQQAIGYLRRKGLVSPLRSDCGEAGHDEGRCGNAGCASLAAAPQPAA